MTMTTLIIIGIVVAIIVIFMVGTLGLPDMGDQAKWEDYKGLAVAFGRMRTQEFVGIHWVIKHADDIFRGRDTFKRNVVLIYERLKKPPAFKGDLYRWGIPRLNNKDMADLRSYLRPKAFGGPESRSSRSRRTGRSCRICCAPT